MRRWLNLVVALLVASVSLAQDFDFDIIIHGGRVLDGTGNPWYPADLGIQDGRIEAVGRLEEMSARVVLDAEGLYVAPGFIDTHTHSDRGLSNQRLKAARPHLAQGVTTVVVNLCGGGDWPLSEQRATYERQGVGVNVALLSPTGRFDNG